MFSAQILPMVTSGKGSGSVGAGLALLAPEVKS